MGSTEESAPPMHGDQRLNKLFGHDNPSPPRLGSDIVVRLPLAMGAAFTTGFTLGAGHGSTKAAYRFRAENAHRLPTATMQWYHYHRSKNYVAIVGACKDGVKMGSKLAAGAFTFCFFEEVVDHARHGRRDFLSTVTAGLTFSGLFSMISRHDVYTAARTAKLGLKASLAYGLIQDVFATLKGSRPDYIDFLFRKFSPRNGESDTV
ncbi:hypothetical protein AJ79_09037 [Helicocarpus griseus UAMH5409]|uniref:Mitochondrial import inner membrane translocase subunit TIM22 n=1 Tax=Helicocarpus griseus UAMH5409 TaxID=1447875 RepID=A0A2B7WMP3_9EURO|nr:hypothetical protein AJ79_09037 [Helicocarpus griseus UAMH5409]